MSTKSGNKKDYKEFSGEEHELKWMLRGRLKLSISKKNIEILKDIRKDYKKKKKKKVINERDDFEKFIKNHKSFKDLDKVKKQI